MKSKVVYRPFEAGFAGGGGMRASLGLAVYCCSYFVRSIINVNVNVSLIMKHVDQKFNGIFE